MGAQGMEVRMEVEANKEADVEVVDTEAVDTEATGAEATQEAASASRASTEVKEQKKIRRCRKCLQAICSTLRPSMDQPVPVAIVTGQPVVTGAGIRIKIRKEVGIMLEKIDSRGTTVGIQHTSISMR